jgi:hypothetical protein
MDGVMSDESGVVFSIFIAVAIVLVMVLHWSKHSSGS